MSTNITPQQIVERYLPDYTHRLERFAQLYLEHTIIDENELRYVFAKEHFAEALAERDRKREEVLRDKARRVFCGICDIPECNGDWSEDYYCVGCMNAPAKFLRAYDNQYAPMPKMDE